MRNESAFKAFVTHLLKKDTYFMWLFNKRY